MYRLDLNDFFLLKLLDEKGNLLKAANAMGISAPAATARIKKIGDYFGVPLIERTAKGAELSKAGRAVLEEGNEILARVDGLPLKLAPFIRSHEGVVTVAANYDGANNFLPSDLGKFFEGNPSVRICMEEMSSDKVLKSVQTNIADIGVCALDGEVPGILSKPYRKDTLVLIVPKSHALAKRKTCKISFEDVIKEPLLCLNNTSAMQSFLCEKAGELNKKIVPKAQVNNQQILVDLVKNGCGCAIVSDASVKNEKGICIVKLEEPWTKRRLKVLISEDKPANGLSSKLFNFLSSK